MPREVGARKQQILQALAQELESNPGSRITTAQLAKSVGVSEAALYRHFPSKARMFESLIAFAEETVFGLAQRALRDEPCASRRCAHLLRILVGFAARNPGITRVLCGEPLVGEHERLRARVGQFFDRCETQLKQVLREYEGVPGQRLAVPVPVAANLMTCFAEGRLAQFCRTGFGRAPDEGFERHWLALELAVFGPTSGQSPRIAARTVADSSPLSPSAAHADADPQAGLTDERSLRAHDPC
ncbi:MAG: nucleoid occlusion factor SlmA [Gammaproteobacteria bacterium]|nr:nucleoid occlusion factor SlmA [Gammaproteobacteria bacterium]